MVAIIPFLLGSALAMSRSAIGIPSLPGSVQDTTHSDYWFDEEGRNYVLNGAAVFKQGAITLVPERAGSVGGLWHTRVIPQGPLTISAEFTISGDLESPDTTADGFALWISSEETMGSLLDRSLSRAHDSVFNYRDDFKGLGVFFSTTTREGTFRTSVSALLGSGVPGFSTLADVPTKDGIYFSFAPPKRDFIVIEFELVEEEAELYGRIRRKGDTTWSKAFGFANAKLPVGYLGITASNRRRNSPYMKDSFMAMSVKVNNLDVILPEAKTLAPISSHYRKSPVVMGSNTQQLAAELENAMRAIHRLSVNVIKTSDRLDDVYRLVARMNGVGDNKQLNKLLTELREDIKVNAEFDKLQGHIENSFRAAHATTKYIAVGLASIISLFCFSLYRRMREMEKKHYL